MLKCHVFGVIMAFTLVGARANSTHLVTTRYSTSQSNLNSNTTSPLIIATAPFHQPSPTSKGGGGTQGSPGINTTAGTPGGSFPGQSVTSTNETPDTTTAIKPFQGGNKVAPGRTKSNTLPELPIFQASPLTSQDAAKTLDQSTARKTSAEQRSAGTAIQRPSAPVTGAHIISLLPTSSTSSTSSTSADTTATYSTSFLGVSPTSTPDSASTPTPIYPAPALSRKHFDARSIIGYVIGGALLLLVLAVALYIFFRRRKQGKSSGMSHKHAMEAQNKQPYSSLIDRSSMLVLDIHISRPTSKEPSTHRSSPGLTWIRDSRGSTSVAHSDPYLGKLDHYENLATTDSSRIARFESAAAEILRVPCAKVRSSDQSSFTKASSSFFGEEDFPFRDIPI